MEGEPKGSDKLLAHVPEWGEGKEVGCAILLGPDGTFWGHRHSLTWQDGGPGGHNTLGSWGGSVWPGAF